MISLSKELKRRARAGNGFALRITKNDNKGTVSFTLWFMVSQELIDELRWMPKDRIDVLWDPAQKEGQLVRMPNNPTGQMAGWALTAGSSENSACRVCVTIPSGMGVNETMALKEHITTNNTVIFRLT